MTIPYTKTESPTSPIPKRCCGPYRDKRQTVASLIHWASPRSLFCLVLILSSENQPSCPPTGFVKSQEGENEEGSEGELVVKFGETLPKVIQEDHIPREDVAVTQQQGWAVAELWGVITRGSGHPRGQMGKRPHRHTHLWATSLLDWFVARFRRW